MRRLLLALLLVPFSLTCRSREETRLPPIILISIDTLRADRLGAATPALNAFRRDGVTFSRAYSHSPLTLPSHATMLTGLLPSQHGARDNVGFRMKESKAVPATLKERGYATGGAVSAYVLRAQTGIAAGFDDYDDEIDRGIENASLGAVQRAGDATIAIASKWIDAHAAQPFFYFLHLYEPHAPYTAPEPHRSRFANPYDAEVAHADALVGGFLSRLKERGLYDDALIVVLSDHGEGLGDHGEDEHGIFLYREAIHVPLLVKLPRNARAGETIDTPVGLVAVAAMLLEQKLDVPAAPVYSETFYPRFHFGWSDLHSLIDGDEHYIDAPRPELYDLARDPGERTNILAERRRSSARLREAMVPLKKEADAPAAIDPEEAEKLAALGYIGASAAASGPLPDPKDRTETFRDLREAFRLYRAGKDPEALQRFSRILEENPNMIDVWDVRSKILFRMGRTAEAIEAGKEALRRSPSSTHLAVDLANALLLAGRIQEAEDHARLGLKGDPARAHELLARSALLRGDLDVAEREARAAVAAPGETNAALYTLARVEQKRGRHAEVLRATKELLARLERTRGRPLRGLHTLRGDALARTGDPLAAEAAFREELRLFPADAEAYRSLIVLLASSGRTDEATQAIREFARVAPNRRTYEIIAETLDVLGDKDGARYWRSKR
jgi:arylsulfatase A-like enzyme/Flp pilus assembly protein TadD